MNSERTAVVPASLVLSFAVVFLFLLQLLTAFVAANYAFGLLNNRLPVESASALVLLSPFLLLLPIRWSTAGVRALVGVVVVSRLLLPVFDSTSGMLLLGGAGVGASFILLPLLLTRVCSQQVMPAFFFGLFLAVTCSVALRAFGSGVDISTHGLTQVIAWGLAVLVLPLALHVPETEWQKRAGKRTPLASVLGIGVMAALTLVYFAFAAPNVIAAWTGGSYWMICSLVVGSAVVWALLWNQSWLRTPEFSRVLRGASVLFAVVLVLTLVPHQVRFPGSPAEYPLAQPDTSLAGTAVLIAVLLLWPVVVIAFGQMAATLSLLRPSSTELGLGFGLGAVFLTAASLAQIFTTTYDYMPVIGPLFRDRFWLVIAAPAVVATAALVAVPTLRAPAVGAGRTMLVLLAALALLTPAGILLVDADPQRPTGANSLTVATFNVEQGYDLHNQRNFQGQLEFLKSLDADIIGLQESDTNRVAGGNDDLVRYLADRLDLYAYSGPRTVTGTFGIALLSRYPIESARTDYLFSDGEQAAVITAQILVQEKTLSILVTHLGNGGPALQLQQVLSLIDPSDAVILLGDFNFRPESEQYHIVTSGLGDGWAIRWPSGVQADGFAPSKRIDYVFVAPSIEVTDARDIPNEESDHPAIVVTLAW